MTRNIEVDEKRILAIQAYDIWYRKILKLDWIEHKMMKSIKILKKQ